MIKPRFMTALAITFALGACDTNTTPDEPPEEPALEADQPGEVEDPVSILRPDIEQPELPEPLIEPYEATIGFGEGGTELNEEALETLREVLETDALAEGGPIVLGGHTDTGGSDAVNRRASRARAEAVRDWLVENGVAEDRFEIVAFGEQNPVQPNALPDGEPDEAGRAANRRVEILVGLPQDNTEDETEEDSA